MWEDEVFFHYNSDQIHSLWDCFAKRGPWPGLYRPLTTNLYYYVGGIVLGGNRVEPYHFISIVFLILNALLLYRLATFFLGPWWAIVPPVLLASRLALAQTVLYTPDFQALLYVFFGVLSVDLFVSSRKSDGSWMLTLSALAFCLALLSKEGAVVLPALLIVYGRLFDDRVAIRPYLVHPIIALSWAIFFVLVLRRLYNNEPTGFTYDFSISNVLRNYTVYFLGFSNWLLAPFQYLGIPGVIPGGVVTFAGTWYVRLFSGVLIISESALLLFPRFLKTQGMRIVAFGFAWFLIATLPFAIFQDRLFMRYSYLGLAGLALCVGAMIRGTFRFFLPLSPQSFRLRAKARG